MMSELQRSKMYTVLAHWLVLLALWTLLIKFVFPIAYDKAYGHATGTHIMWDFWWVAHLILAWSLTHWSAITYRLAMIVSVAEIVIIVVKFYTFFSTLDPSGASWTVWRTNWFINKVFVLACFIVLLVLLLRNKNNAVK